MIYTRSYSHYLFHASASKRGQFWSQTSKSNIYREARLMIFREWQAFAVRIGPTFLSRSPNLERSSLAAESQISPRCINFFASILARVP